MVIWSILFHFLYIMECINRLFLMIDRKYDYYNIVWCANLTCNHLFWWLLIDFLCRIKSYLFCLLSVFSYFKANNRIPRISHYPILVNLLYNMLLDDLYISFEPVKILRWPEENLAYPGPDIYTLTTANNTMFVVSARSLKTARWSDKTNKVFFAIEIYSWYKGL